MTLLLPEYTRRNVKKIDIKFRNDVYILPSSVATIPRRKIQQVSTTTPYSPKPKPNQKVTIVPNVN